ncbi:MAG: hypothetical protein HPY75_10540 [Actinobacteria bacterium]|nr:hypothetical protein [Actinomycetota bacterium]
MGGRFVEIDGDTFDLDDPEDKKRAIRAWLKAKSRERSEENPAAAVEAPPFGDKDESDLKGNGA